MTNSRAETLLAFRMPTPVSITGRSSTITNSFVNGIIPVFPPSVEEIVEALSVLGMSVEEVCCAYCGGPFTEWDHLRPLVKAKRPTGYVSEIANLVPACGKCNQSKGGSDWRTWLIGGARLSPTTKGIANLEEKVARLEAYEQWREPRKVDFSTAAGEALWTQHWQNHERMLALMKECEVTASQIRAAVRLAYQARPSM